MDDPVKIIFRYKNNNGKYQHQIYIYIGSLTSSIINILKKIQKKNITDTLLDTEKSDINKLEKRYGRSWYRYFFNIYHIENSFKNIEKTASIKNNIITKFGKDWFNEHIESFKPMDKQIFYNYGSVVREEILEAESTKKEQELEIFKTEDYRTIKSAPVIKDQLGGNPDIIPGDTNKDGTVDFDEGLSSDVVLDDEELDLENIEKLYEDTDEDKDIKKTSDLIKKALDDDSVFKKSEKGLINFDISKDDKMYDEQLKDSYHKHYVTSQYIYKSDTISTIKNKICCSIKNNPKFGNNAYIVPSRQYLYSEYKFEGETDKIMIGQKWVKRSELLNIDIVPNRRLRYYEDLHENMRLLRDNMKRYGSKIKWEDNDNYILYDYDGYYINNEIYMIDLYNELGLNYSVKEEKLTNLIDVYIKVYFKKINSDNVKYIIDFLNGKTKVEEDKISVIYNTINNDLILENEIMNNVEKIRGTSEYKKLFKESYIIQSVVHTRLKNDKKTDKIDMFRIFNEFDVTKEYPFVQYHTPDGNIVFKYDKEEILKFSQSKKNTNVMFKWFESAPYGLSFKIKMEESGEITQIKLSENGRLEYKTSWKEEKMATIKDVMKTYKYAKQLVKKINDEDNKTFFEIPEDHEFKFAFINSIQKFILPENHTINHNDLSEFSRYFFPYVSLVISPRKRQSKIHKKENISKFGTYLRYKRISKYYNRSRIEHRILYFIRNYEYTDKSLADVIAKQFNITIEKATKEIERVKEKYPNVKKSRKVLKKLENIPKYKPPGIGIDIQGKKRDNYKIRVSGARNKDQLSRILDFLNILIYLYAETYLLKKPERKQLKNKLSQLTKIAKRRNKVDTTVNYDKEVKTIKQMTSADKDRLGYTPAKGQNQWSRVCQNTAGKNRQPIMILSIDDLVNQGFKVNKETGLYEKKYKVKDKKGKYSIVTQRAVGLEASNKKDGKKGVIYYTCSSKDNGEYMHIGFLTRSNNPYGLCMPCCYKKDFYTSKNATKRNFFMKCIGKADSIPQKEDKGSYTGKVVGDQLYILQDTNKIQEGRLGRLPRYLDYYFNTVRGNKNLIKQHYLVTATPGYFFKYGSKQDSYNFLNAVAIPLKLSVDIIKKKLIEKLEDDKSNMLFTALNNGDIRTRFEKREKFIEYIRYSNKLNFELINHMISIPKIISKNGINIIMFNKQPVIIKDILEKEKVRNDFTVFCQNTEELDNIYNPNYDTIFLLKENTNIYPIVFVSKKDKYTKNINITYKFNYKDEKDNIVKYVSDYYLKNCNQDLLKDTKDKSITAKKLYKYLIDSKKYKPKYQVIDGRNKCKYIITDNSTILPTKPSGSIYNLQILKNIEGKLLNLKDTINNLEDIDKLLKGKYNMKIIGVYYKNIIKDKVTVIAVFNESRDSIPTAESVIGIKWLKDNNYLYEEAKLYDKIDKELEKGKSNIVIDERIRQVNRKDYLDESYNLFRLEFSEYINRSDNINIRNKIVRIINNKKEDKKVKLYRLRKLLYRLADKSLVKLFEKYQKGGKYDKLVHIINNIPDTNHYMIKNTRDVCMAVKDRESCNANIHCRWSHDNCYFAATQNMIIKFVNKISQELVENDYKAHEILKEGDHFVSDIVDFNSFTHKEGQKIIKSSNTNINKLLNELFGKENLPTIGKRRSVKLEDDLKDVDEYKLENIGNYYLQTIISNNLTILRGFVNGYTWAKHQYYDINSRNLGYYSDMQTDMANYFRSIIIDWLTDLKNFEAIETNLKKYMDVNVLEYIDTLTKSSYNTNGIVEYYILSKVYNIPIVIFNDIDIIEYIYDNGTILNNNDKEIPIDIVNKYKDKEMMKRNVNIMFIYDDTSDIPNKLRVIYI